MISLQHLHFIHTTSYQFKHINFKTWIRSSKDAKVTYYSPTCAMITIDGFTQQNVTASHAGPQRTKHYFIYIHIT